MNKAVELITAWGAFDANHPDGSIADFCRHYLTSGRESEEPGEGPLLGGLVPPSSSSALMKLLGRVVKLHAMYTASAVDGTGLGSMEEFSLLIAIHQLGAPRKTEAIGACVQELSTGTDMINRLKRSGYIEEYNDETDRRSKRVKISADGMKALVACQGRVMALAEMILHDISEDDRRLCFQLLKSIDMKFSSLWQQHKGRDFAEVYGEVVGEELKSAERVIDCAGGAGGSGGNSQCNIQKGSGSR